MSQHAPHPDRTLGPICRAMVEAGHVGYPCTLPQGHTVIPADDPEPCYAMEAGGAVRRWQTWRIRQDDKAKNEAATSTDVRITTGEITATVRARRCKDKTGDHDQHLWEPEEENETFFCDGVVEDKVASPLTGGPVSPEVASYDEAERATYESLAPGVTAQVESQREAKIFESLAVATPPSEFAACGPSCRASGEHTPADPKCVKSPAMPDEKPKAAARKRAAKKTAPSAEPTKQRDGDQVLPTGGQECVQDLVIAKMEASKKVGIERYGSTLMTFNGRRSIQDAAEEARDLMVYLTLIETEGLAARDTLVKVVSDSLLDKYPGAWEWEDASAEDVAALAVDRIMGWVTAQLAGGVSG